MGDTKDEKLTSYRIEQGDKVFGRITRFTLAALTVDAMKSDKIANKVTFECVEVKGDGNNRFEELK